MPSYIRSKTNFSGGEIDPRLHARDDVAQYTSAVRTMTNMRAQTTGYCRRRNGTQFIKEVKETDKAVRLIPFQFSPDDAFILEFGENYIRFYTSKANVTDGGSEVEVTTTYTEAQVQELQYAQFANTLYIAHPDHEPKKLTRISSTEWTFEGLGAFPPPTEELGHAGDVTLTLSGTTGSGSLTASGNFFVEADVGRQIRNLDGTGIATITAFTSQTAVSYDIFETFDSTTVEADTWELELSPIGELSFNTGSGSGAQGERIEVDCDKIGTATNISTFRKEDEGKYIHVNGGIIEITEVAGSGPDDDFVGYVVKTLTSLDASSSWTMEEPAWSSTRGYPRSVALYDQRLIFGGTVAQPQTIWLSEAGILDSFGVGPLDSDSIAVDIVSAAASRIEWMASGQELIVGTSGGEVTITGSQGALTPSGIQARPRTYYGADSQQAAVAGNEILFRSSGNKQIRTFVYDFDIDSYRAQDVTLLAQHFTDGTSIKEIAYAQVPETRIYAVLNNGEMITAGFDRGQQVIGWSKYTDATGTYEQVQRINQDGEDQIWVVVNRTLNGGTRRYIEVFNNGDGSATTDGYSDSYLTYSGSSTSTLTGLDHLEGQTVQVKVDGASQTDKVVTSGSITLDTAGTSATVGLAYTSTVETLDENLSIGRGSFLGQEVRWVEPILRVYQSTVPAVNEQSIPSRDSSMEMDQPVDLFTGFLEYSSTNTPRVKVTTDNPYPLVLMGIFGTAEGDG